MSAISITDRIEQAQRFERERLVRATPWSWRDPTTIPPRDWIYGRQLLRGSVSLVVAPGAVGKTALLTGMALSMATGRDLLGKQVWGGPKRVWLWNLEDSQEELDRLIAAAIIHWGIRKEDIADRLFVNSGLSGAQLKIAVSDRDGFRIARPVSDDLVSELVDRSIDVFIADPFVSCHSANENDNSEMDAVAKEWSHVGVQARCAVGLAHHSKKLGGEEVSSESSRGASSLVDAARSAMVLNRMSKQEAEKFGIEGEERRRYFRTFDDKPNRAPPAEESDWYKLASVSLGNSMATDDGRPSDNIQVVIPWTPPQAFDGVTVDHLRRVQAAVAAGEWRKSDQAKDWVGHAVAEVMDLDMGKASDKKRVKALLLQWLANGALQEDRRKDGNGDSRPFVIVGRHADDVSAPSRGAVRNGAEARDNASRTTTPIIGVGGAGAVPANGIEWCGGAGSSVPQRRAPNDDADDPAADENFMRGR